MMRFALLFFVMLVVAAVGCNSVSGSRETAMKQDSAAVGVDERNIPLTLPDSAMELYRFQTRSGAERAFFELQNEHCYLYTIDSGQEPRKLELFYDRCHDGRNFLADGWWTPLYYKVGPDGRSLYVVSRMHANSDGWVTEYQLFKIDCETLETRLLTDCAAIEVTENGFTIAVARLTNEDTAQFTYQEVWVMHDQLLDWNGDTISTSKKEYSYEQMVKRFAIDADGYHLVKGFQRHIIDED